MSAPPFVWIQCAVLFGTKHSAYRREPMKIGGISGQEEPADTVLVGTTAAVRGMCNPDWVASRKIVQIDLATNRLL
jgi:hypothetical protein